MGIVSTSDAQARLDRLKTMLKSSGYDAAALIPGATIYYLTGVTYHLGKRPQVLFIPVEGEAAMIVPSLEVDRYMATDLAAAAKLIGSDGLNASVSAGILPVLRT